MVIFYTGTKNSEICAKNIAEMLHDELVCANDFIKTNESGDFFSERPFVFVCPTYSWRIPKIFEKFIRESKFNGNKNAYFVMTCGSDIGNAEKYIKKLCQDKEFEYCGVKEIVMPENYTAMFPVPDKEETRKIVAEAYPECERCADYIKNGKILPNIKICFTDSVKSGIVNFCFYNFWISSKGFRVSDECTSCSLCEKLCPTNSIIIKDGKPVWGKDCTHCMACINACPSKAIEYKNVSVGKTRIYNGQAR